MKNLPDWLTTGCNGNRSSKHKTWKQAHRKIQRKWKGLVLVGGSARTGQKKKAGRGGHTGAEADEWGPARPAAGGHARCARRVSVAFSPAAAAPWIYGGGEGDGWGRGRA
jgi:hypothetical protein